jgi:hypothetical protein
VTDDFDRRLDEPYSSEDLGRIAESLDPSALSNDQIKALRIAAQKYFGEAEFENKLGPDYQLPPLISSRKDRRKALKRVANYARCLKDALADEAFKLLGNDQRPVFDADALDKLATTADKVADNLPKGGPDPEVSRKLFVGDLVPIFEAVTQQRATRRHDPLSGLDYGPFLEFAKRALKPLNAGALKGLEHVVRKVLKEQSTK